MPRIQSSVKDVRKNNAQRAINSQKRSTLKTTVKRVSEASDETKAAALNTAYKVIDKAVKSGLIKKNTGARQKSKLAKSVVKKAA